MPRALLVLGGWAFSHELGTPVPSKKVKKYCLLFEKAHTSGGGRGRETRYDVFAEGVYAYLIQNDFAALSVLFNR